MTPKVLESKKVLGSKKVLEPNPLKVCPTCDGTGHRPPAQLPPKHPINPCWRCGGSKEEHPPDTAIPGSPEHTNYYVNGQRTVCKLCNGAGTNTYPQINSDWLRAVRAYAGLSRKELAHLSGYSCSYIASIENDHTKCSTKMLKHYEDLLK